MGLPLQPDLHPPPGWYRRLALLLALALAVLAAGWLSRPHPARPIVLGNDEDRAVRPYAAAVAERIRLARQRIWVVMFTVWMGEAGEPPALLGDLAAAAARGVEVVVCLDRDDRETGGDDRNAAAAAWLGQRGVRVLRDEGDLRTHAKTLVIDGRWVLIGSHNWTRSGIHRNRELSVLLDDPRAAAEIEAWCRGIPGWPAP